ncbi:hypothetical protein Nepgr_030971 [Nepenthes gracilis]|uniref:Uncharacterized protein n=1 Tax=Nepenthes gracilis TaxID=150966 RepID=A0AAD3Y4Q9_NEPGR|nr:hypothetical protein Nepgr_030971 [Nepenthes gracilis]
MGDNLECTQITIDVEVARPHIETPESKIIPCGSTEPPPTGDMPPPAIANDESDGDNGLSAGDICQTVLVIIVMIIIVPLFILYAFTAYLICSKDVAKDPNTVPHKEESIYQKVKKFQGTAVRIAKLASVIYTRIMVLLLT